MTPEEMKDLPVNTLLLYHADTYYDGSIVELLSVNLSTRRARVNILVPGVKGLKEWTMGGSVGTIECRKFSLYLEDVGDLHNPIIRKIKDLDKRFKAKTLRKVKVEKLPLGA